MVSPVVLQPKCSLMNNTYLPPIPAILTLAKRRHRLVRAPRLRLVVRHLLLLAFPAFETRADAPLRFRHLGVLHVFLLVLPIQPLLLLTPQILGRHCDESFGGYFIGVDPHAEGGVGFVLEVLEEGADFGFVRLACFGAELGEAGGFDRGGGGDDGRGGDGGGVREAVVEKADAAVAGRIVGAVNGDAVFLVVALVGGNGGFGGF